VPEGELAVVRAMLHSIYDQPAAKSVAARAPGSSNYAGHAQEA
jgi:hypothetical protein